MKSLIAWKREYARRWQSLSGAELDALIAEAESCCDFRRAYAGRVEQQRRREVVLGARDAARLADPFGEGA
ncbi:MAG: hypothetical protein AAGI30_13995 [Planctomycetota bacterium]